jgi:hypothetical protein
MLLRCTFAGVALFLVNFADAQAQNATLSAQQSSCRDQVIALRNERDKRFTSAERALKRKASATELCPLLTRFADAEGKMLKYVEQQGVWCGIPPQAVDGLKASHLETQKIRKEACAAAAEAARRPRGPSLSDALNAPVPDASTTSTGRGTLDSLTGNPLAR